MVPAAALSLAGAGFLIGQSTIFSTPVATASLPPSTAVAAPATAADPSNLFVNIAERTTPSVVNIFTTKLVRPRANPRVPGEYYDLWRQFFGQGPQGFQDFNDEEDAPLADAGTPRSRPLSLGTGFVVETSGNEAFVVTNNHVIDGADEVKIKFTESSTEQETTATVVGTDAELDVALLKVNTKRNLTPLKLGDSEALKVGEWIAAIGSPFGHGHSLSHGIVSAKERTLPGGFGKYLQVDAPINPGNSGGPLVNLAGEVVGINNAIDARGPGIGFAIPINAVKAALPQLKNSGHVERGYIGIAIQPRPGDGAPMIAQVTPGEPAARAGLRPRDIVKSIDGRAISTPDELVSAVTALPVGKTVRTEIERAGKTIEAELRIAPRPAPRMARNG